LNKPAKKGIAAVKDLGCVIFLHQMLPRVSIKIQDDARSKTAIQSTRQFSSLLRLDAPMPMVDPRHLLAVLAAVFRPAASSTLSELARELLPLAALVVGALSNAALGVILPAQVSHYHSRPVLHVVRVVANRKLLNQREYVKVVRLQILFHGQLVILFHGSWRPLTVNQRQFCIGNF
jgi:hypothetical protein